MKNEIRVSIVSGAALNLIFGDKNVELEIASPIEVLHELKAIRDKAEFEIDKLQKATTIFYQQQSMKVSKQLREENKIRESKVCLQEMCETVKGLSCPCPKCSMEVEKE